MEDNTTKDKARLLNDVDRNLKKYDDRKDVSRGLAIGIRLTTTLLGAAVTILIGWKYKGQSVELLVNFALVCGAIISVMNAVDTFWSFSSRWTHYKDICTQLIFLKKDIENEESFESDRAEAYRTRLNSILMEARKGEVELHKRRSGETPAG